MIRPTGTAALWGKVQEVRDAILDFKRSRKPIVAYMEFGGEQEFFLASACDKVFLMPTSSLDLTGLASYELFLRGTLDKIGAYPDALHVGDYKTASNIFTEHTYTPAHREMAVSLNTDLYEQLVRGLADGRHKSEAEIRTLIDHGPFLPEDARPGRSRRRSSSTRTRSTTRSICRTRRGKVRTSSSRRDYRNVTPSSLGLDRGQRIAIIYAVGLISSGPSSYDSPQGQVAGSDTLVEYLRKARADSSIKAIVLRIDSPGGSAIASDVIWREVQLTRKVEAGDRVDVRRCCFGRLLHRDACERDRRRAGDAHRLDWRRHGQVRDRRHAQEARAEHGARAGRAIRRSLLAGPPVLAEERRGSRADAGDLRRVRREGGEGRNTTPEKIDAIGQGRVWTGRQAKQLGLVDELGGLERALALAKQRVGIPQDAGVELVVYPPRKSIYEIVANPFGRSDGASTLGALLGLKDPRGLQTLMAPMQVFRRGEPLALMPNVFVR